MLPKINRVKKKKDFETIFKKGASFKNNLLILKIAKNNLKQTRVGLVVSQKVSKKATVRNKIRRRLSEAIKIYIKDLTLGAQAKSGLDLVLIVLPGAAKSNFLETKSSLNNVLGKAKLIKNV